MGNFRNLKMKDLFFFRSFFPPHHLLLFINLIQSLNSCHLSLREILTLKPALIGWVFVAKDKSEILNTLWPQASHDFTKVGHTWVMTSSHKPISPKNSFNWSPYISRHGIGLEKTPKDQRNKLWKIIVLNLMTFFLDFTVMLWGEIWWGLMG